MEKHSKLYANIRKLVWATTVAVFVTFSLIVATVIIVVDPSFTTRKYFSIAKDSISAESPSTLVVVQDDALSLLADDPNIQVIKSNCTVCHSAKLVIQYRASREGWESVIRWMQRTQNLWDLGVNEKIILDYLAKHYAPQENYRRKPLQNIEWYELD